MTFPSFKKESLKQWIAYFSLCCVLLTSYVPSKVFADPHCCVLVDDEDARRTRTATIVAGATVIALVGGIAYAAFGSSGHGHHHSHSHSSNSYSSDSYGGYYSHHHSPHHHSHSSSHHSFYYPSSYYSSNPYSIFSANNVYSFSGSDSSFLSEATDPQFFEREGGNLPARCRKMACSKHSKESSQLSGSFISHPSFSATSQGSFTAFIQLPDGTTEVLGSLLFSGSGGNSISYGPFTQKGSYAFGIRLDEGSHLSTQAKMGVVEINMNGSTVQSGEFLIPAHSPAHYEPGLYYYDLQ